MNAVSSLIPVGGSLSLSRVKISSRWPSSSVIIGEKFRFSLLKDPPRRCFATNYCNRNIAHVSNTRQLVPWKENLCAGVAASRNQSYRTTATISDLNNDGDDSHRHRYQLYKYKICPFSNIAKVFLEYRLIPFESVEVNPLTKAELAFSEKYRKVPIVTIFDSTPADATPTAKAVQQLNGTEEILPHDYQLSMDESIDGVDDDEFASSASSMQWQDFARNKLAPLLYPNICRTLGDSFRAFDYVHSDTNSFSTLQRYSIQYIGSVAMYFAASKIKKKYEIEDVEIALEETLGELESELSKEGSKFLRPSASSEAPHLGDLSVFGVLKGLEGLPLWNKIFDKENPQLDFPNIRQWYADVDNAVETRKLQTRSH